MTTLKTKEIESSLKKKGFQEAFSHHKMYYLLYEGKKTSIYTKLSHGADEYGDNLIGLMAKQCRLNKKDFIRLIECSLVEDEYKKMLISSGHLKP